MTRTHKEASLLAQALPFMLKRDKFLQELRSEKGENHAAAAGILMRIVSAVGMLASILAGIEANAFDTPQERKDAFTAVVQVLNVAANEVSQALGLTPEEAKELGEAATEFVDALMFSEAPEASTS